MTKLQEAIAKIEREVSEMDRHNMQRMGNMFYGPPGLEERLTMAEEKAAFCLWCLGRICAALKEQLDSEEPKHG
jgi:hypothetical protein